MTENHLDICWDAIADYYPHKLSLFYRKKKGFDHALVDTLVGEPKGEPLLLDAGSGTGYSALYFAKCGYNVIGIDFSKSMVSRSAGNVSSNV